MKYLRLLFISLLFFSYYTFPQTVLNGSFESNTGQCLYNLANSDYNINMQNSVGFGPAEQLDILGNICPYGQAQNGSWFVGVSVGEDLLNDALSLELSSPIVVGNTYTLTYYDRKDAGYDTNVLEIGISTQPDDFGNLIYTTPLSTTSWTERTITFTTDIDANHITVRAIPVVYGWTHIDNFFINPTATIEDEQAITEYFITQNFPNPFNPSTTIKYQTPEISFVTIKVYDMLGNEIATLVNEQKPAGNYEVEFNGTDLPSGIYFYQLKSDSFIETKKMILMK